MAPKKKTEPLDMKLNDLKAFSKQDLFYLKPTELQIDDLAKDIKANRLRMPIEVLGKNKAGFPEGTIIKGHRRLMALKKLGRKTTRVRVRHDLCDADAEEIEEEFLRDNFNRRQMSKLEQAHSAYRLHEIQSSRSPDEEDEDGEGPARDRVGKLLGMTGRNLDRILNVLKTPVAVQQAWADKKLTLIEAEGVSRLDDSDQQAIAKQINKGVEPKTAVAKYQKSKKPSRRSVTPVPALIRKVKGSLNELKKHAKDLAVQPKDSHRKMLLESRKIIDRLLVVIDGNAK